jgi:hypothetical protein
MDCTFTFGHNIYIDDTLVGYISSNHDGSATLFMEGNKFASLSSDGLIEVDNKRMGHIDEGGDVYLHDILVGEIDPSNDLRFYGNKLGSRK